jgi:hypothetical protein
MARATVILAAAVLLTGCAHSVQKTDAAAGIGSASYRMANDTGMAHYKLALGQVATGATLEAHEPPAYPEAMLATCPPLVDIPARVIVGTQGGVDEVRMNPATAQLPFADAVRQAVQRWRYSPLTITRWAADADGTSHPVDTEAKPFSLDYVFTFRCEHGHTTVSSGPQPGAR